MATINVRRTGPQAISARTRTVLPPTYLLAAIASMTALHVLLPWRRVMPWPWSILGVLPLVAGVALNLLADAAFKKHATTVKPFETSSSLLTSGVFRVCRNPMYLGMVLILTGIAGLEGSVTPWIVVPIFGALIDRVFIRAEERMLAEQFGDAWRVYASEVRRWI
jgi:protein-S-isoprenylcysteine O-methyltransferase Ste14